MYIRKEDRFYLTERSKKKLFSESYQFGFPESGLGEIVYQRTYSRIKEDGTKENWHETVQRVTEGIFSIRKWYAITHKLPWSEWDEIEAQRRALEIAISMLKMKFLPPGRGLWIAGTEYMYERGGMSLYNCAFVEVNDLAEDAAWIMDLLMNGVGVGFSVDTKPPRKITSLPGPTIGYSIPDTREGWVISVWQLLYSYMHQGYRFEFEYDQIRPEGSPINGFGGVSSGAEPLKELHERLRGYCEDYIREKCSWTRLLADVINAIGVCVIAGNVRRSAEIAIGSPNDEDFLELKNYDKYPERAAIGGLSNNSVRLTKTSDFTKIPDIAKRILRNGEPGLINLTNIQKFGRFGHTDVKPDNATGLNPCGEIPLESYEVCNLAEVFPTRCRGYQDYIQALKDATFYASTVSLLPTHQPKTNLVIAKNHRIGISMSGIAEWLEKRTTAEAIKWWRKGYDVVREENRKLNEEMGISPSIRVTTVKPSGSISQVAGVSSGMHYPIYKYAIRRMSISSDSPLLRNLVDAGYYAEPKVEFLEEGRTEGHERFPEYDNFYPGMSAYKSTNTHIVEIPLKQDSARSIGSVSMWEQALLLQTLQREWADNSVSATIYFDPEEDGEKLQHMLASILPTIKSVSCLPHLPEGAYVQMPYQEITKEEYEEKVSKLTMIRWDGTEDSEGSKFCENDVCTI